MMKLFTPKKKEIIPQTVTTEVKDIHHNGLRWIDIVTSHQDGNRYAGERI
jgi:hypothetical protein